MRVNIRQKDLEITPALQTYIDSKIIKPVRKLLKGVAESDLPMLDLEFGRATRHHRKGKVFYAEANLKIDGKLLRSEIADEDIRTAIDLLEEELGGEIKKFKGRAAALEKRGARKAKSILRFDPSVRLPAGKRAREEGA